MHLVTQSLVLGIGATLFVDHWALFLTTAFGVPSLSYAMVGRWLGHCARGRFAHEAIGKARPIAGERAIGWIAHYAIGIAFAAVLLAAWGTGWADDPTPDPALAVGLVSLAAPFFVMQPGMGTGIAARKTPASTIARLRSVSAHLPFGVGLCVTALLLPANGRSWVNGPNDLHGRAGRGDRSGRPRPDLPSLDARPPSHYTCESVATPWPKTERPSSAITSGLWTSATGRLFDLVTDNVAIFFPKFGHGRGKDAPRRFGARMSAMLARLEHDIEGLRFIEAGDTIVVEGREWGEMADGTPFPDDNVSHGRFCNVFEFRGDLISPVRIYVDPDFPGRDTERIRALGDG